VDDAIDALEPQYILNSCYQSDGLSHPNCRFIEGRDANNTVTGLVATLLNLNKIETMGLDFTADYGFPLAMVGVPGGMRLDVGFHANYLLQYDQTINQEFGETVERAGTISPYNGSFAHLRWLARLSVSEDNWSVNSMVRFIGGADVFGADPKVTPTSSVPAVAYWDLAVSYHWQELALVLGIDNVLNKDPPFLPETGQNANLQTYDFIGRYVFLTAGYRF
jgi:outer membrane receptor protein involved in Fe transport